MWVSILIPLVFVVVGSVADVSHLKNLDKVISKDEKIPVLLTNELPVPSVEPLEVPKNQNEVEGEVLTSTVLPEVEHSEIKPVQEEIPEKTHLPILLTVPSGSGRSLNLGEVDPGFSRPIITHLPNFPFGRNLNLADPIFYPLFNQQYRPSYQLRNQIRYVVLPENEYLPPVKEGEAQNELENEYLPPQARNRIPKVVEADKLKTETKEEEIVTTEVPVIETTEAITEENVTKVAQYQEDVEASDSVSVTKQGTVGHDEVVVVHKQQVPEKIEIIPSSGYFYPRPRVLFLYK